MPFDMIQAHPLIHAASSASRQMSIFSSSHGSEQSKERERSHKCAINNESSLHTHNNNNFHLVYHEKYIFQHSFQLRRALFFSHLMRTKSVLCVCVAKLIRWFHFEMEFLITLCLGAVVLGGRDALKNESHTLMTANMRLFMKFLIYKSYTKAIKMNCFEIEIAVWKLCSFSLV